MTNESCGHTDRVAGRERSLLPILCSDEANPAAKSALAAALRLFERVEHGGRPDELTHALTQIGYALIRLKALDAAETYLEQALRWAALLPGIDAQVDLACRLAEVASARAALADCTDADDITARRLRERARERACETAAIAVHVADAKWEARVLLRVADVFESCGDHADALSLQSRVLALLDLEPADARRRDFETQALTAPGWLM